MQSLVSPLVAPLAGALAGMESASASAPPPVLLAVNAGVFGNKTPAAAGFGQVDLAAAYRAAGSTIPSGTQTWDVQIVSGTNAGTALGYNDASSLTASGYSGTGNTGRTPYRKGALSGAYVLQYRVKINGGTYSNWANYSFTAEADSVSCGNNYSSDNYPFGILGVADGATAYGTNGVRKMRLMVGLSRPDFRMGSGFNFASGAGWSTSAMLKVMWANNQLPPTLSAISFGSGSGIWLDLEYDGVTVTGGRLYGNNQNVPAKVVINGDDNLVTRCNLMNSESDFTAEHTGANVGIWGGISMSGNRNRAGIEGDYSYANYISHVFYGIYMSGTDNVQSSNVVYYFHGRGVARTKTSVNLVARYNLIGQAWRTRYPSVDVDTHLDYLWSEDNSGGNVEQNPTLENNFLIGAAGSGIHASSARLIVFGATGASLDIATPKGRGNLVIAPYTYGLELGRWSGECKFQKNTLILAISGDYSVDIANFVNGAPDYGSASMRIVCAPASVVAAATMTSDGNFLWNTRDYSAGVLAVTTGTDVQNARGTPTNFLGGVNPKTVIEAEPASRWVMPTKASEITALISFLFTTCARTDATGAIKSDGSGWETLP